MDITLECKIVVTSTEGNGKSEKKEVIVDVNNATKLAYLMEPSHLPVAESRFQNAWDSTVAEPVQIQFSAAVQKALDVIEEQRILKETTPMLPEAQASQFIESIGDDNNE